MSNRYNPDFNPIETAFAKRNALLRTAAARTKEGLWEAIRHGIDAIRLTEGENSFAGYDGD
jgi:transposase